MLTEHEELVIVHNWDERKTWQEKFHFFNGAAEFCASKHWDDLFTLSMLAHYRAIEEDEK